MKTKCWIFALLTVWVPVMGQMTIALGPSAASPVPLGTVVTWTTAVTGSQSGTLEYRFRTRAADSREFRTVVDYGPKTTFAWSSLDEGTYQIEVSVKNTATGETAESLSQIALTPLTFAGAPVITPTAHPLVFIYSAPACQNGSMSVQFQAADGVVHTTPSQLCGQRHSMNFYLAGMRAQTPYTAHHIIQASKGTVSGPAISFTTPAISVQPPPFAVLTPGVPAPDGVLLQTLFFRTSVATDLSGNIIWYSPADAGYLTRPETGGTFLSLVEDSTQDPSQQFFHEFDLAGITLAETNAARVNEQLADMGMHPITSFHHEARKLPDGRYLILAASERLLTDVQGPGTIDVLGDTILVLDRDLQVQWAWDAFDHLDPRRVAILGESCKIGTQLACAPFYQAPKANDWLHSNSLQFTPDGNILVSIRHQDWVIKIDYRNGAGSGKVLWRLGNDGDFQITSTDPNPWFSHQHDPNFEPDGVSLTIFDDGNTRAAFDPTIHSRGQVLHVDEQNRKVSLDLNADLGTYSQAVGSAQKLPNGDYHFDSGFISTTDDTGKTITVADSVEVDASGNIVYAIQFASAEYRTFRMTDLYTAP